MVRIDTPDGATGTGLLVAPGWVLTCAHVVEGLDTVRVVPDRRAAPEGAQAAVPPWVDARVRARSDTRDALSASAFWPFPDLALLELQLRAGDAPPGLSGAPLVCPQRRAITGLMSVSRDPDDARGGWASPVAALDGGPGVPDELARLGREVLVRNHDVCWRHRNAWQSVLPIPGPCTAKPSKCARS